MYNITIYSTNIKTWISDISYASTAVKNVKQATTTGTYANAVKNLSLRQAELALSTKNLSAEQQREILVTAGLIKETGTLTVAQATEALTTDTRNAADVEALMLKAGLITELGAETTATITVDAAKLKELVDTKVLTQAEAELLAMKAGVTLQSTKEAATLIASNAKLGSSFAIMGKTAGAALKGIGKGLLSFASAHPVLAIGATIIGSVAFFNNELKKLEKEQKEMIENAKALQEEYRNFAKDTSGKINSLTSQAEEFDKLSKGVDKYGNNISLASDEYDRYKSIVAEILGYSPELIQGYDAEGNAIADKNGLLERSIELLKEEQRQKLKEMTTDEKTKTAYEGAKADWEQTKGYDGANTRNDIARWFNDNATSGGWNYEVDIAEILGIKDGWKEEGNNLQNAIINNIETVAKNIKEKKAELLALKDENGNALFTEAEIDAMIDQADTWQQQYADWQRDIEDAKHGMDNQFELYAQKADGYNDLTDAQKAFVNEYIKTTGDIIDADGNLLSEDEIIKKAEGYTKFVEKLANDPNFEEARTKINTLFSLDKSQMSASEYEKQVNAILKELQDKFNLTDDEVMDFKIALGFTFTSDGKTQTGELLDQVKGKLKDEFDGKADELTLEELQIAAKIVADIPEGTLLSWDELQDKIKETQGNANKMTASLDNLKTASDSIGTLQKAFKELSDDGYITIDTLSSIKKTVGESIDNWDEYEKVLMNAKVGSEEFNDAMTDLTYKTLDQTFAGSDLSDVTEQQIAAVLRENDVVNADAVAHEYLTYLKAQERAESVAMALATDASSVNLAVEAAQCGMTAEQFSNLIIQQILFNHTNLDIGQKLEALQQLGLYANWTAEQLAKVQKTTITYSDGKWWVNSYGEDADNNGELDYMGSQEYKGYQPMIKPSDFKITPPKFSGGGSGKSGGGSSKEKDPEKEREDQEKKELEQLKASLDARQEVIEKYKESIDIIDFGLDISEEKDFALRTDLLNSKLNQVTAYGQAMRKEFERVSKIVPKTADQAEALSSQLSTLGSNMRNNVKTLRETQIALQQLKINAVTTSAKDNMDDMQTELSRLEKRIGLLNDDNKNEYKYTNKILNMETLLPTNAEMAGRRKNRSRADQDVIRAEEETQNVLNDMYQEQIKKNENLREDERQALLDAMAVMRND